MIADLLRLGAYLAACVGFVAVVVLLCLEADWVVMSLVRYFG